MLLQILSVWALLPARIDPRIPWDQVTILLQLHIVHGGEVIIHTPVLDTVEPQGCHGGRPVKTLITYALGCLYTWYVHIFTTLHKRIIV